MAKSKRKRKAEIAEKKQEKKFFAITAAVTLGLLCLLFILFKINN